MLHNYFQVDFLSTEIFSDGAWSAGPDMERIARIGCAVNIPAHNLSVVIKNNASIYDWNAGDWLPWVNNSAMQFAGRGYACGFVSNGSEPYIIVAGGNDGLDASQVLPLGNFLNSRDVDDIGAWMDGPVLPVAMSEVAWAPLGDESFVMVGGRVDKVTHVSGLIITITAITMGMYCTYSVLPYMVWYMVYILPYVPIGYIIFCDFRLDRKASTI